MNRQDRQGVRTATDIERKYNFGQTFADVYGLISDTQKAVEEANKAVDSLTPDEIFNRLTNYGAEQGIYRGADDHIYINAEYIKSGYISGDRIEANSIDSTHIKANAINGDHIEANVTITAPIISGGEIWGAAFYGWEFNVIGHIQDIGNLNFFSVKGAYLNNDYSATIYSPAGVRAVWDFWKTDVYGDVDFSNATVSGFARLEAGFDKDVELSADGGNVAMRLDAANRQVKFWFGAGNPVWVIDANGLRQL